MATQLYLALIGSLLLQLYSGARPTRRTFELIHFYMLGMASAAELEKGLSRLAKQTARAKNK